ncbi:MAG: hypothetical protein EHM47_08370 [Ignavibacteriales bacterium]|nr:MAG: hypothetical protein EHM47_08370 [Ignavibacteriales bacterium]
MSIKSGKIKILLHGESYHTKIFCEQLENYKKGVFEPKYYDRLDSKIDYDLFDLFHLISPPLPVIKKLKKFNRPIIYHWIGTDVYRFLNDSIIKRSLKKRLIKSANVKNLVVSKNLKDELKQLNISSKILPLVKLKFTDEIPPLPEKFSVLAYIPANRWEYYKGDIILQLAAKMPETEFHIVASGEKDFKLNNVFTYNFIEDLTPFYTSCSVLIRLTVHDGLPKMILEALSYGREVLWNWSFPHCHKVTNPEECMDVLQNLKVNLYPNTAGKEFVEKKFNTDNIIDEYFNLCRELLATK